MVANNLRTEDLQELKAFGADILNIPAGVISSEHATTFYDRECVIAGVAGVVRECNHVGQIWMLCTPQISKVPHTFVRGAHKWLAEVEKDYRLLWNLADARNHVHRKLLRNLGFRAMRTIPVGREGLPFLEIVKLCA